MFEPTTSFEARSVVPRYVGGNGTWPPEDCGGSAGYADAIGRPLKVGTNDTLPAINRVKRNGAHIAFAGHT